MTPEWMAKIHATAMTTSRPWSAEEFRALLSDRTMFSVASDAGFALGRAVADEAELLTIAVSTDARRRGIGTHLLAEFEAAARDRGAVTAFLEVAEDNAAARALYVWAGWNRAGHRPAYYPRDGAPAADALIMRKSLT